MMIVTWLFLAGSYVHTYLGLMQPLHYVGP